MFGAILLTNITSHGSQHVSHGRLVRLMCLPPSYFGGRGGACNRCGGRRMGSFRRAHPPGGRLRTCSTGGRVVAIPKQEVWIDHIKASSMPSTKRPSIRLLVWRPMVGARLRKIVSGDDRRWVFWRRGRDGGCNTAVVQLPISRSWLVSFAREQAAM